MKAYVALVHNEPVTCLFRQGDDVVLAEGTYQGRLGVFVQLTKDLNWAEVEEQNGGVRTHPVAWLALAFGARRSAG